MKSMKLNIRQKLVIFTCALVVVIGGAFSMYAFHEGHEQLLDGFDQKSRGMAQVIASSVAQEISSRNRESLAQRLKAILANQQIE